MLKILLIVFREVFEVCILLSVTAAATSNFVVMRKYIVLGVVLGIILSSFLALLVSKISNLFYDLGDEIFSISIMFVTVVMIMYTVIWISKYNQKIEHNIKDLTKKIQVGAVSKLALTVMVSLTVLREGTEIVLLLHGITTSKIISTEDYTCGVALGSLGAILTGYAMYKGLRIISKKYLYRISSLLLVLIAAEISAEAAGIMNSSGIMIMGSDAICTGTCSIYDNVVFRNLFKLMTGYDSIPNVAQIIFYIATLLIFCFTNLVFNTKNKKVI